MHAVQHDRPRHGRALARERIGVAAYGIGQAPGARSTRMRTARRFDAVDGTHPLGEAHVVRAVVRRALPWRRRCECEWTRLDEATRPTLARARDEPLVHEV